MRHLTGALSALLGLAALAGAPAAATDGSLADVIFSEVEKAIIEHYYRDSDPERGAGREEKPAKKGKSKKLPPGLAKKDALPPGLAKQLERNHTLPPGLAKRALPDELRERLPPHPPGHERVIVDGDVVLIERATGIIKDIIRDVLRPGS